MQRSRPWSGLWRVVVSPVKRLRCTCFYSPAPPASILTHPSIPVGFLLPFPLAVFIFVLVIARLAVVVVVVFPLFVSPIADFQPATRGSCPDAYVKCTMEACLPHPAPC